MNLVFLLSMILSGTANAYEIKAGTEVVLLPQFIGQYEKCFTFSKHKRYKFAVRNIKEPGTKDIYYQEYYLIDQESNLGLYDIAGVSPNDRIKIIFDLFSFDRFRQYGEASIDLSKSNIDEGTKRCFSPNHLQLANSYPRRTKDGNWEVHVRDKNGIEAFIPKGHLDLPADFFQ